MVGKLSTVIIFLLSLVVSAEAQTPTVPDLEADLWLGFTQNEDSIVEHEFINNGREILLIGNNILRLYEVETGKEIYSVPHDIQRFSKGSWFNLNLVKWLPYIVESEGKWLASAERVGDRKIRSVVVRNLADAKTIAVMEFPDVAMDIITFDEQKKEISTFGTTDKKTMIAKWSAVDFKLISSVAVEDHKWHQYINDGKKMLVGSGDTRFSRSIIKQGETLALYDIGRGEVEKNFTATDLKPRTAFTETVVSSDEKYLISRRDDRYFVWEIEGDGSPKYELKAPSTGTSFDLVKLAANKYGIFKHGKNLVVLDISKSDKPIQELRSETPKDSVALRGFTEDGEILLIDDDVSVSLVKTNGDRKPFLKVLRDSPNERFYPISYSQELKLFAIGRNNRKDKKEFRTELYDLDGKLTDTIGIGISDLTKISPDGNKYFNEGIGFTNIWNVRDRRSIFIPLKVAPHVQDQTATVFFRPMGPQNIEKTAISPNFDKFIKYGDDLTTLYDMNSGEEINQLLLKANAKYTKEGKVKKSGLGNAGWVGDGSLAFALSSKRNMIGFWKIKK